MKLYGLISAICLYRSIQSGLLQKASHKSLVTSAYVFLMQVTLLSFICLSLAFSTDQKAHTPDSEQINRVFLGCYFSSQELATQTSEVSPGLN